MKIKICVVGLGYVGLPLAIEFDRHFPVIGFDVSETRINQLKEDRDSSGEVGEEPLKDSTILFTADPERIKEASFVVICVPTPIDKTKRPNLSFLESASELVGKNLSPDSVVVYESTVYPGCTEEVCVPILEKFSGLRCGEGFKVGYSPERINPGDKEHTIDKITKVIAGMDPDSLETIDFVYSKITKIHPAPTIKTAEAAKVIENIQRDLNIALMNELAVIFNKMGVKTKDVLAAAGTKWNFHKYHPGLVGGHCIGVDPYYLTHKAVELGYHPEVILAGRKINDNMHKHVVELVIKELNNSEKVLKHSKVALLGLTFKENVKDCRNSKAKCLINELKSYGVEVFGCDPLLGRETVENVFGVRYKEMNELEGMDGLVVVSPHQEFGDLDWNQIKKRNENASFVMDLKGFLDSEKIKALGLEYCSI
ncbi:nucleotide sugar dehydrogenase [Candidatus Woesearchaeota archaeon]|nr:nucleotide sugar dehydrogenase [Candidatus Woesearchaeota archaeon]